MRRFILASTMVLMLLSLSSTVSFGQSTTFEFHLGFKTLADQIPDVVGTPLENEHYGANGDSLQQTTTGLMVWRKADNWTAFTNGSMTWINGPYGVQERANSDRFPWESDNPSQVEASQPPAVNTPTPQPTEAPKPPAVPTPVPTPAPMVFSNPNIYHAKSPEYGMFVFLMGYPTSADRDLRLIKDAGFSWGKTLIQWGQIESKGKGQYDWSQADMAVESAAREGIRLIARVDDTPSWARKDHKNNAPPDNYADYGDFINALVNRYKTGSPYGHIDAVEVWNEPNLAREWGDQRPNAAEYTKLLASANNGAKMADPSVLVLTAGLSPTETDNADAVPDDVFLQQMYDAGAKGCFDVLGAHAPGFKAPPEMSPEQVAADPNYGGHRFFTFRRVEDLRNVMVRNGDAGKQIWLTEFGWTSDSVHPAYSWYSVTEQQKADYLVRAFQYARANWPWVGVMCAWGLPEADWSPNFEQYWWSITNPDGTPRPAYLALKAARENGTLP